MLEHTYNVDAHHVPRRIHLDGPSDPAHVLSPLSMLTSLTHFDLEEQEEQEEKQEEEEEVETVRVRSHDPHNHHQPQTEAKKEVEHEEVVGNGGD